MKRSKSSFYHFTNFYPIGMQLMPKCSYFNAQSCDMRRYVLYRVPVLVIIIIIPRSMIEVYLMLKEVCVTRGRYL